MASLDLLAFDLKDPSQNYFQVQQEMTDVDSFESVWTVYSLGRMVLYLFLVPWFGISSSLGSRKFIGISLKQRVVQS